MPMKKNLQMENISNIKTLCSSWNEDIIHDNEKYTLKQITRRSQKDKYKVTYAFMPKTADGWKASKNINAKRIIVQNYDFCFLDVYQSKGTKDYFITILNKTDKDLIISDKYNSEFEPLISGEDSLGQTYITYYAHIPNFDSSYSLTVNGTEIVLQKP